MENVVMKKSYHVRAYPAIDKSEREVCVCVLLGCKVRHDYVTPRGKWEACHTLHRVCVVCWSTRAYNHCTSCLHTLLIQASLSEDTTEDTTSSSASLSHYFKVTDTTHCHAITADTVQIVRVF